jgi:hypothetical protein
MYCDLGLWKKKSIILINKENMFVILRILLHDVKSSIVIVLKIYVMG